jgi:hypothetical protein
MPGAKVIERPNVYPGRATGLTLTSHRLRTGIYTKSDFRKHGPDSAEPWRPRCSARAIGGEGWKSKSRLLLVRKPLILNILSKYYP